MLFYTPSLAPSDMTGLSDDGGGYYYYTPAKPGLQTVSFKVTAIDLEEATTTRMVQLYHDDPNVYTTLTYEYYLVSTEFLRRQFKRANHATNLGNGKELYVVSAFALRGTTTTIRITRARRVRSKRKRSAAGSHTDGASGI